MRSPAQALLLVLVASGLLVAAEPWTKPPAAWTQEEAVEVLTDSPWARRITLLQPTGRKLVDFNNQQFVAEVPSGRLPIPRGADGQLLRAEYLEGVYVARWSSAGIVQAALERLQGLATALADLQAPPPELSPGHYVVTVRVEQPPAESGLARASRPLAYSLDDTRPPQPSPAPPVPDLFAGLKPEELQARAELRTSKKVLLKPERVLRHGLGAGQGISFFFPRRQNGQETLPAGTQWAEFVFAGVQGIELKAKFKLKEMQVAGRPDY